MKAISTTRLRQLSAQAKATARQRLNLNLHESLDDPVQRFCNALEPGTYVRPHRHDAGCWECFALLAGRCAVLIFAEDGSIIERIILGQGHALIAEIAGGTWHSLVALEPHSVVFEIKPGPMGRKCFAPWAPEEGDARAAPFLDWLERAQAGQRPDGSAR